MAGTMPITIADVAQHRHRLAPAEATSAHVGADRTGHRRARERDAERDRHQHHALLGGVERQRVAIGEHRQRAEHEHQRGGPHRPGQTPGPGDRDGHDDGQIEGHREHREVAPVERQRREIDQTVAARALDRRTDQRRPRPRRRPRQVQRRGDDDRDTRRGGQPTGGADGSAGDERRRARGPGRRRATARPSPARTPPSRPSTSDESAM